jgi:hypothetical protein
MKKTDYDEETYYKKVEEDLLPLTLMTQKFEEFISDYALAKTEDCWDEEYDQVVRAFFFEKGTSIYIVTISPEGLVRAIHSKYSAQLAVQVHNVIVGMHYDGWFEKKPEELPQSISD